MYCYIMGVTLMLVSFNPNYYQNETWSRTNVLYDKNLQHVFESMLKTGN